MLYWSQGEKEQVHVTGSIMLEFVSPVPSAISFAQL